MAGGKHRVGGGGKTKFANPQMVKLGRRMAFANEENMFSFGIKSNIPKTRVTYQRMLLLPPDCVVFCDTTRRTPTELYGYVTGLLEELEQDPGEYSLRMDWC
jgi:hypothetical protein